MSSYISANRVVLKLTVMTKQAPLPIRPCPNFLRRKISHWWHAAQIDIRATRWKWTIDLGRLEIIVYYQSSDTTARAFLVLRVE